MAGETIHPDQLLSPAEAARILGYKVQTLATWRIGRGQAGPKFEKHGRTIRYAWREICAWRQGKTFSNTVEARFSQNA